MAFSDEQFDELVARLERDAARHPRLYSFRLGAFASLGYLYVFGILACLLVVIGLLLASLRYGGGLLLLVKKLVVPLGILIWVVMRSMWVRLEAPPGLELTRKDYPDLFAMLDNLRRATQAPAVHTVLLNADLNAAVVQVPRLGMFGWQKNYLVLGLPLMQLLPMEEFRSVLAHEFGHLSGAHGRFGAWIYRVRAAWATLAETLQQERHWGSFMFVPFFSWFAPQFAAFSFVKARQQEYEADRLAAETVGPQHMANALIRVSIKGQDLGEHYWPSVLAGVSDAPEPTASPYRGLLAEDQRRFLPAAEEQLRQSLLRKTSTADTHPCLKDRIEALHARAAIAHGDNESAASVLFGSELGSLVDWFDAEWRSGVAPWWQHRHQYIAEARQKLDQLDGQDVDTLSDEDLFNRAALTEEVQDFEAAIPLFRALASRSPDHSGAAFAIARFMLQQDDDDGIARIEAVMDSDPDAVIPGCGLIIEYLERHGRDDEIPPYNERYFEAQTRWFEAQLKRHQLHPTDKFLPHDLPPESLKVIEDVLTATMRLSRALLAQKKLPESEPPLYILGFELDLAWHESLTKKESVALAQQIAEVIAISEDLLVMELSGDNKPYRIMLDKVDGAEIYRA